MKNDEHRKRKTIIHRLSRVEGHIRAVKKMLEEGQPCTQVLIQLAAVRGAVEKAAQLVLEDHMESCLRRAIKEGDIDTAWDELREVLDVFL